MASELVRFAAGPHPGGIWVDPVYHRCGYPDALPDVRLRPEAARGVEVAARAAAQAGHGLLLWDGWRPLSLQQALHRQYRDELARTSGLSGAALEELVARFVTDPDRREPPPPHTTGGAIDLTLCDRATGAPRDMGGEFDELTERSEPAHYDGATDPAELEYAALRETLRAAMAKAGFVRLPSEWWHFEYLA
jgi:D-alanyl-D-alanine dipeptidase